jgi:2',5'-phosphodiesterase
MHADMCIGRVQALAKDRPYIIAGDFNLKPSESVFRYLTSCKMPETDHFFPTPFQNNPTQPWKPTMKEPVRSAYSVCNDGKEPDFTNYARVREDEPFIDTLDYIFVSKNVEPISVQTLPARETAGGPYPNEHEPSDHIMIASTLKLTTESKM